MIPALLDLVVLGQTTTTNHDLRLPTSNSGLGVMAAVLVAWLVAFTFVLVQARRRLRSRTGPEDR